MVTFFKYGRRHMTKNFDISLEANIPFKKPTQKYRHQFGQYRKGLL